MNLLIPGAFLVALTVVVTAVWVTMKLLKRYSSAHTCSHCGSRELVEINREMVDTRMVEQHNGGLGGGGDIRLHSQEEISYHCRSCNEKTSVVIGKTN